LARGRASRASRFRCLLADRRRPTLRGPKRRCGAKDLAGRRALLRRGGGGGCGLRAGVEIAAYRRGWPACGGTDRWFGPEALREGRMSDEAAVPVIVLEKLTKSFGEKKVLKGVDLTVSAGHVLGYIGPNGAGKTTTVKILVGMLDGFGGTARVCGFDVAREPLEVKRRIGYVPEAGALYEALTPMEFLSLIGRLFNLPARKLEEKAVELLRIFGLAEERDKRMTTFSKGMKQKVLIIAGLIHNPQVIFLDEPLAGLDANSTVVVKELIANLASAGRTVFYCSHMMDIVERVCDRIAIVDEGRIVADGTFKSLQSQVKAASLERIFTQLTSEGGHEQVARDFVRVIEG